jgi:hypothetical protein
MCLNEHGQSSRADAPHLPRRARLPTITLPRARCPGCGGISLRKYRSIHDQGDGSGMSWLRCLKCETRFKVVVE